MSLAVFTPILRPWSLAVNPGEMFSPTAGWELLEDDEYLPPWRLGDIGDPTVHEGEVMVGNTLEEVEVVEEVVVVVVEEVVVVVVEEVVWCPVKGNWFKLSGSVDPEVFCDNAIRCME